MSDPTLTPWRKSERSGGGNCVETVLIWVKSARSQGNGACVEVAVAITDHTQVPRSDPRDPRG
jgi:hypothetical protein